MNRSPYLSALKAERIEQELSDSATQFVRQLVAKLETAGGPAADLVDLATYGPLIYKAGAAHVFKSFDCYPKT